MPRPLPLPALNSHSVSYGMHVSATTCCPAALACAGSSTTKSSARQASTGGVGGGAGCSAGDGRTATSAADSGGPARGAEAATAATMAGAGCFGAPEAAPPGSGRKWPTSCRAGTTPTQPKPKHPSPPRWPLPGRSQETSCVGEAYLTNVTELGERWSRPGTQTHHVASPSPRLKQEDMA